MMTITKPTENGVLDRTLDPFRGCLPPAMARRLVNFRGARMILVKNRMPR